MIDIVNATRLAPMPAALMPAALFIRKQILGAEPLQRSFNHKNTSNSRRFQG